MIAGILMIVGGLVWLAGELLGVFTKGPTTSGAAWWLEKRIPILRVVLGVFLVSLVGHILFGWWLLP